MGTRWHRALKRIIASRTRNDWVLIGIVGAVLLGILLFVTHITPYKTREYQPFYEGSVSKNDAVYYRAKVLDSPNGESAKVQLLDGDRRDQIVTLSSADRRQAPPGAVIVVSEVETVDNHDEWYFVTRMRIPGIAVLAVIFVALVAVIGGRRGLLSTVGLVVSLMVIGWFIVPLILSGYNAFFVAIAGAYIIAIVSVLISHGARRRTYLSIACICLLLGLVALFSWLAMWLASLSGFSDEAAFYLTMNASQVDMWGVVAGGMVIATLGVLDDIVTTQVATVEELHLANKKQSRWQLFLAASSVGGEHIASVVNTLALAYAGASLPFILLATQQTQSIFLMVNSEHIATEIVRTLVASIGLVVAVPLSTFIATVVYTRSRTKKHARMV